MRLLLSGEGPTDMGSNRPTRNGEEFVPGPMAWIVDQLVKQQLCYSLIEQSATDPDAVAFVSKAALASDQKQHRPGKPRVLPGYKRSTGTAYFVRNAEVLGARALADQTRVGRPVVAVLFRDADGTRSSPQDEWQDKVESMFEGFGRAGFSHGVPMVPRPKSEAWLLCALKDPPYQHCDALENAPGNDASPQSLKHQLSKQIGRSPSAKEQADWVRDGIVDPLRLNMPSFRAFADRLAEVLQTRDFP